nr:transcriptional regulator [Klebsiella phage vB_Kpl_K53PH164C2]
MIGNHNNALNAAARRRAVEQNFHALNVVRDEMNAMLDLPLWDAQLEDHYDGLRAERDSIINRLRLVGMFL